MPYDLSANDFTKMALVDLSDSKQMISSKLATRMWAPISVVRSLYHAATWLVLLLPKIKGKVYKRMKRGC